MELPIPNKLEKLWDTWDIPACVLLSLWLQVFLLLFASLRQRSRNAFLGILIWSVYMIADWIAAVTIGLITKVQVQTDHPFRDQDLYALWASFLLLHLGGPDTITSFALEDNEFWLRHLFGLILQVMGAAYCIFLTLPNNNLWLPTILVFVVGSVKYAERTMALYLASLDHFLDTVPEPEDTDFDFNKLASESNHIELLMVSYSLFKCFKGIIFGNPLSSKLVQSSRMLFSRIENPKVGFKLIEYELSLMYEVFHTKVAAVRSGIGLVFRLSSFCFIFGAFIWFRFVVKDGDHDDEFEMSLTYALLIGAVVLDTISGIKLMIFSDWILVSNNGLIKRWRKLIPECVLKRRRWCGSVSQYNMIDYCLDIEGWIWKCNKLFPDCFRVMIDCIKFILFSSSLSVGDTEELMCLIFERLTEWSTSEDRSFDEVFLGGTTSHVAQRLLQFHLGTEICYHHQTETEIESYTDETKKERRMSKLISDYIFYLLIMKPEMMGVRGDWKKALQDTFAEMELELMENEIYDNVKACNHFMDYAKESRHSSESLLLRACKEARQIQSTEWDEMSDKWIALLCVATSNCRPMLHAQQPSRGGELFTFIRFLIVHLCRGEKREQKSEDHTQTGHSN